MRNKGLRIALLWNDTVFQEVVLDGLRARTITAGPKEEHDFTIEADALSAQGIVLAERGKGGESKVFLPSWAIGKLHHQGETTVLGTQERDREVVLEEGDFALVAVGEVSLFFQCVDTGSKVYYRPWLDRQIGGLVAAVSAAIVAHLVFLLVCELNYDPGLDMAQLHIPDRFISALSTPPPEPEPEPEPEPDGLENDTSSAKAEDDEGVFGKPDSPIAKSMVPKVKADPTKKIDMDKVGIHNALTPKMLTTGALGSLFKKSDTWLDAKTEITAMDGTDGTLALGRGSRGMGLRGMGTGGGGKPGAHGSVHAIGSVNTGGGVGARARLKTQKAAKVKGIFTKGAPRTGAFCEKGNIRSVVGRGTGSVRYCYEKSLQTNPSLSGKVVVRWTVNLQGGVVGAAVASSTLGNKSVESCIVRSVSRWRFAAPKGGHCVVSYPFSFKAQK